MKMHRSLSLSLVTALILGPSLPLLAEDVSPTAAPAAEAVSATAGAAQAVSATVAEDAPDLPELKAGEEPAEAPAVTETAQPELPKDVIATPGPVKPDLPESRYKWGNFALGFLGGAAIGGAAGVLFLSKGDDGSFDSSKAQVMGPAVGAGVGLAFGLAALFLGATTPEAPKPPKADTGLLPLPAQAQVADLGLSLDLRF